MSVQTVIVVKTIVQVYRIASCVVIVNVLNFVRIDYRFLYSYCQRIRLVGTTAIGQYIS